MDREPFLGFPADDRAHTPLDVCGDLLPRVQSVRNDGAIEHAQHTEDGEALGLTLGDGGDIAHECHLESPSDTLHHLAKYTLL